jgi:hypothetical protein
MQLCCKEKNADYIHQCLLRENYLLEYLHTEHSTSNT